MRKINCQNRKTSRKHNRLLVIVYFLSVCITLIILSNISFNITLNIESILGNILQAGSPKLDDMLKQLSLKRVGKEQKLSVLMIMIVV